MRAIFIGAVLAVAAGCVEEPTIKKIDSCADQQRLWCELAGRPDEVVCWNAYFDWCAPEPRLTVELDAGVPLELHDTCMSDLLGTTPAPLNRWLPERDTIPASCRAIWDR